MGDGGILFIKLYEINDTINNRSIVICQHSSLSQSKILWGALLFLLFSETQYSLWGILHSIYGTKIGTYSSMLHINLANLLQMNNSLDVGVGVGIQPNYVIADELQIKKHYYLVTIAAPPKMSQH